MNTKVHERKQLSCKYTTAIKGIAILLMIVHHSLGLPESWFEPGLGYGQLAIGGKMLYQWIGNPTKICVSVFAFLTGWSYWKHKTYTWRYSARKCLQLLLQYWLVLFLVFYPCGYAISRYVPLSKREVFWNVFSIHYRAVSFSWYVLFYIFCMLTLPVFIKCISGRKVLDVCLLPVVCAGMVSLLDRIVIDKWYLIADLRDYFCWMPVVWMGCLAARYDFFGWLQSRFEKLPGFFYVIPLVMLPIARGTLSELLGLNMDVFYAPLFVFCCFMLLKENTGVFRVWSVLGKYSMYIWFVHALFFWEQTRRVFQPLVYKVNQPVVTILLILLVSLVISLPLHWLGQRVIKRR